MLEIGVPLATKLIEKEENVPQFKKKLISENIFPTARHLHLY
jgi:hypothetical protein